MTIAVSYPNVRARIWVALRMTIRDRHPYGGVIEILVGSHHG